MKKLSSIISLLILPVSLLFGQTKIVISNNDHIILSGGTSSKPDYLVVDNPNPTAITAGGTNSWIISENEFNMVQWDIGTNTGPSYVVPFGYSTLALPVTFNINTAGTGSGNIKFSTWHSQADNWTGTVSSTGPPHDVTNMNPSSATWSPSNTDDSYYVVDRFYVIDANTGYTTKPAASNIIFPYVSGTASSEVATPNILVEPRLTAQRFNTGSSTWSDWFGQGCTDAVVSNVGTVQTGPVSAANLYRSWAIWDNVPFLNVIATASPAVIFLPSGSSTLTATGATSYVWSTGATTSSLTVTPSITTEYTVTGTSNGCTQTAVVTVVVGTSTSSNFPVPILDWTYTAPSSLDNQYCGSSCDDVTEGEDWIYSITQVHDQYGGYIASGYTENWGNGDSIRAVILRFSPTGALWWEATPFSGVSGNFQQIQEFRDNQGPPNEDGYHYVASAGNFAVDIEDLGNNPGHFNLLHTMNLTNYFNYISNSTAVKEKIIGIGEFYNEFTELIDPNGNNHGYVFSNTAIMDNSTYPNIPPFLAMLIRVDSSMNLLTPTNDPSVTTQFKDPGTGDYGYGLYANNFNVTNGDLSAARSIKSYWDGSNKCHIIFTGWDQTWANYQGNLSPNKVFYTDENRDVYVQEVNTDGSYGGSASPATWGNVYSPSALASAIGLASIPVTKFAESGGVVGNGWNYWMNFEYPDWTPGNTSWVSNYNWGTDLALLNNYSNSSTLYVNTQCNSIQPYISGVAGAFYRGASTGGFETSYVAFQDIVLKVNPANGSLITGTTGANAGGNLVKEFDGIDFFARLALTNSGQGYAVASNISYNLPITPDADISYAYTTWGSYNHLGTCNDIVQYDVATDTKQSDQPYLANSETYYNSGTIQTGSAINCMFGFAPTDDGGFLMGGNNEINDEDYYAIKLKQGCNSGNGTALDQLNNPANASSVIPFGTVITSSTPQTWSSNKLVQGYVYVRKGGSLTINGSTASFAETSESGMETKIVVDTGGTLHIENGATLTSIASCGPSVWDGINVSGYTSLTQTGNSGVVNFTTSGGNNTISNADTAIETIKEQPDWSLDLTHAGGYVTANSTNFTDNYCGIKMYPYLDPSNNAVNQTYFSGCNFLTDNSKPNGWTNAYAFASLSGVRGVNFNGSTFENTNSFPAGNTPDNTRGDGIIGNDAAFTVQYLSSTPCTFSGLYYGIYASSVSGLAITVKGDHTNNSPFTNNYYDIYQNGIHNAIIQNNIFTKNALGGWQPSSGSEFYGQYMTACTGYTDYFNSFSYSSSVTPYVWKSYGIVVNNSSSASNVLDYNAFSGGKTGNYDMYVAEQAQSTNSGLQFQCNTNSGAINFADIANATSGTLADPQGSSGISAGNQFSGTCGTADDFYNAGTSLTYYYYTAGEDPTCNSGITATLATGDNACSMSRPLIVFRGGSQEGVSANMELTYDAQFVEALKLDRNNCYRRADSLAAILTITSDSSIHNRISGEIESLNWKAGIITNDLVTYFINNSKLSGTRDSAIDWIKSKPRNLTGADLEAIINLQISEDNYQGALTSLTLLNNRVNYANYCALMNIVIDLKQDPIHGYYKLLADKQKLERVKNIADDTTKPGCWPAKALLAYVYNKQYPAYIYPLSGARNSNNSGATNTVTSTQGIQLDTAIDGTFKLYPNPAYRSITIEYVIPDNTEQLNLSIFDMTGNKIATYQLTKAQNKLTEDVSSLSAGFYMYALSTENKIVKRGKLVIVR